LHLSLPSSAHLLHTASMNYSSCSIVLTRSYFPGTYL
jgi:hypothetical protein